MDYSEFLAQKRIVSDPCGFDADEDVISSSAFDWQRTIIRWACRRGRAAVWADCGLGKSLIQLNWAEQVRRHTGGNVLILAPLAVARQTQREGEKFGIAVTVCRTQSDVRPGINVTNYQMLDHFDPEAFSGIVLDESSILKAFEGSTRKAITAFCEGIPYRLACTATPAPNDLIELTNHAEFLGVMRGKEIIALFFTQDGNTTHSWRLKGHAKQAFWQWVASWAVALRKPSDLGFADDGFVLPPIHRHQVTVEVEHQEGAAEGAQLYLFGVEAQTLHERRNARKVSLADRVAAAAKLVNESPDPWVVWCNLNAESEALTQAISGAVEITGSDSDEHKEQAMLNFTAGRIRVIVTKPRIAGFGMNWQHCAHMAFVGLSDSYEELYQAERRCWRFGQQRPVHVHIITSDLEGAVVRNIQRKEQESNAMFAQLIDEMQAFTELRGYVHRDEMTYREDEARGRNWRLLLGDSIKRTDELEPDSIGLSVYSPPFPGMYAYTNSAHDIGNTNDIAEFMEHYRYLVPKILRATMPGRMTCVHLMQLTAMKSRDGYIGLKDYRGEVIKMYQDAGWIYAGEVTIDKNPQVQATRNKERGLLFKTLATDSSLMRMALADYLIYFRKPGDNPIPIRAGVSERYDNPHGWISEEEWIEWAAPVWYRQTKHYPGGIRETDVLNVAQARDTDDERHLCPLQLGVIERAIKLWSAPGDTVFSPFNGIGSEGYMALKLGRKYIGIELKESYWRSAIRNLKSVEDHVIAPTLFDALEPAA